MHNIAHQVNVSRMPITTTEASQRTGVPKRTIIAAINRGALPAQKLPGLTGPFLIDVDDLTIWVNSRKKAS